MYIAMNERRIIVYSGSTLKVLLHEDVHSSFQWLSILFCLKDDLKAVGSKKGWCPYFLARHAVSTWASLIVLVSYVHFVMIIVYFAMIIFWRYMGICDLGHTGCKESQFYSLPFGQAVASVH